MHSSSAMVIAHEELIIRVSMHSRAAQEMNTRTSIGSFSPAP